MKRLVPSVLAALVAAAVLGNPAAAQAPASHTIALTELHKGATFAFIDNAPKSRRHGEPSASLGDELVFTNPLADASGARVGHIYGHCSTVIARARVSKATFLCHIVVKLTDGTLTAEALTSPSIPTSTGAITGGSGAYIGARGSVVSVLQANEDSKDIITLLD